jgi:putative salt-induced outer membrane protein YdiY
MSVASADKVELEDGDVLRGTVVEQTDAQIVLEHSVLGRLEIPRDQITDLDIEGKKDVKWDSHVNAAFNAAAGNTEESSLRIGGRSRRRSQSTRLRLDATYYLSTSESVIDNNKLTLGIEHDWLLPDLSRWFFFADGRFDYDQFESWKERIASHVGPGYDIIGKEGLHLDARVGVGARKEWGSQDDAWKPEGLLGLRFDWEITRRQSLSDPLGRKLGGEDFQRFGPIHDHGGHSRIPVPGRSG